MTDGAGPAPRARSAERGGAGAGQAPGHLIGAAELAAGDCVPLPAARPEEVFLAGPPSSLRQPAVASPSCAVAGRETRPRGGLGRVFGGGGLRRETVGGRAAPAV